MEFSVIINKGYIHDNECKCKNTIQITLDDDFNVPDNKADIEHNGEMQELTKQRL